MKKALLIEKRKKAVELRESGWSIRQIARYLVCDKKSVNRWLHLSPELLETDKRGWPKGNLRKHSELEQERIVAIRDQLEQAENFFIGSEVIQSRYLKRYGERLPKWFIHSTLKAYNRVKGYVPKERGRSKYKQYPSQTLRKFCKEVMSIDFVGPKYLSGSDNRINFLSAKYIRPGKMGMILRVSGQTSQEVLKGLEVIWSRYGIPDLVKMDNDSAFGGHLSHISCIGQVTLYLLNLGVKPLYIAPRSPWNNGNVEGFNSVFSRKLWHQCHFNDEEELDAKLEVFNTEYASYSQLLSNEMETQASRYISNVKGIDFSNRNVNKFLESNIYFLRIVNAAESTQCSTKTDHGTINILGRWISLDAKFINLFVFCELNLKSKKLFIYQEIDSGEKVLIKQVEYVVNNVVCH